MAEAMSDRTKATFDQLWKLNPDELELELGRRMILTLQEVQSGQALTLAEPAPPSLDTATLAGPILFLRDVAQRFLEKFNRQLYSLACDPSDPDHDQIRRALDGGAERLGLVLSGMLVASFGLLPGIAGAVAVLVAKRFVKAAHAAVCASWQKQLDGP